MGKKRRSSRRSFLNFSTMAKFLRVGALLAPAGYAYISNSSGQAKLQAGLYMYTGYNIANGNFNPAKLLEGYGPFLLTSAITYGIPKINGMIRRL